MAGQLILLTGGSGHLGYRTLIEALSKGYNVRAAVRSDAKIAEIKAAKSTQPYLGQLSFTIVPDITKDGAFDEAVQGVDYVVHLASPLAVSSDDYEADIIQPAIRGTLSILYSALKEAKVQRVVITSSVIAVGPVAPLGDGKPVQPYTADSIQPDPQGPYSNPFAAYGSSKILAYNRTREFITKEKPSFTVVNVMPTFVIGKNELATTPATVPLGSNRLAMAPLLGSKQDQGPPAIACHVDDVAFVHIAALDPKIEGNQNFGVNYNGTKGVVWDDALDIVKKHFPKEVENGIFPLGGSQPSVAPPFDASRTEQVFNFKHKNFEEMIISLAGHYVEVSA
jgi:nucleoside-diphosphate-sugar epimerase